MNGVGTNLEYRELSTPAQRAELADHARRHRWGVGLLLVGWLHLAAFGLCWYLTVWRHYHEAVGYLAIWVGELLTVGLIVRLCGGPGPSARPPLQRFVVRLWTAYFLLAFNLGSMNTLRGHTMFEFFPAMASLASFAFLMLTFTVHRRFFLAVLVMFAAGLLMAAYLQHAYLIFALAWWLILEGIGLTLWLQEHPLTGAVRMPGSRLSDAGGAFLHARFAGARDEVPDARHGAGGARVRDPGARVRDPRREDATPSG